MADKSIPPDILRRLRAGEQVDGYTLDVRPVQVQRGTGVGADAEWMDDPSGATETLIYKSTGSNTWKTDGDTADVFDPDGNFIGVSSGDSNALAATKFIAASVGGYYAAGAADAAMAGGSAAGSTAGGTTLGQVGTAAGKGALVNGGMTAARGGSLSDIAKSAAIGAVSGGAGAGGAAMGWNPAVTGAVTGAGTTALRGGDASDILQGAAGGAFSGYVNSEGVTGNAAIDKAIAAGGSTAIRGGDGQGVLSSVLQSGLDSTLNGATRNGTGLLSGSNSTANNSSDQGVDALDEAGNGIEGGGGVDEFDFDAWTQEQMDSGADFNGSATDGMDVGVDTTDAGGTVDPYGPDSGRGQDTLTNMGATDDTGNLDWAKFLGALNSSGVSGWGSKVVQGLFGGLNSRDWASLGLGGLNAVAQSRLFDKATERGQAIHDRDRAETLADRAAKTAEEERLRQERFQRMKPGTGLLAPHFQKAAP